MSAVELIGVKNLYVHVKALDEDAKIGFGCS